MNGVVSTDLWLCTGTQFPHADSINQSGREVHSADSWPMLAAWLDGWQSSSSAGRFPDTEHRLRPWTNFQIKVTSALLPICKALRIRSRSICSERPSTLRRHVVASLYSTERACYLPLADYRVSCSPCRSLESDHMPVDASHLLETLMCMKSRQSPFRPCPNKPT